MTLLKPGLIAVLFLGACASFEERCVSRVTEDLTTVNRLIVETQQNLARGYRIETEVEYRPRATFCSGFGYGYGYRHGYGGARVCTTTSRIERERQVAIDPVVERRKLANLRERQAALQGPTQRGIAACQEPA